MNGQLSITHSELNLIEGQNKTIVALIVPGGDAAAQEIVNRWSERDQLAKAASDLSRQNNDLQSKLAKIRSDIAQWAKDSQDL